MAEWKKVVVSGSNVSQLNNDAGYLTSVSGTNSFETISVNGVSVVADNASDTLTVASGSGAGLSIVGNAGADSITFTLGGIPNASLANSTISGVSLGDTLNALTAGSGLNNGGGTFTGAATRTFSVDSGSMLPYYSSSIFATVSGDVTIDSSGVASIQANAVTLGTDTTGDYVATLGSGTGVTIGSNTGEGSTPTITVDYGSTANTAVQGNTTISLTGTANEVEITGTTAQALGGAPSYTIGLPDNVTIGANLTVTGDLFVNGTTTTINTTDLYIEDKFIVLASGSATAGDGGIIIDRGGDAAGNIAFGYDSTTDRWGYQNGLTDSTNAIVIGTNGNSAFAGYVFTEAAHTATKPTSGEFVQAGAIYANTDGTLWMYA
jgi:hypothetical protein